MQKIHFNLNYMSYTLNIAHNEYLKDSKINTLKILNILCVVYSTIFINMKVKMCPLSQILLASTFGIK